MSGRGARRLPTEGSEATADRFGARQRANTRARWLTALCLLGILVAVGALVWAVWFSTLLSVRTVTVDGVSGAESEAVRAIADRELGRPLARVDVDALGVDVTTARRPIAEARVERSWPSTLVVKVIPRTAALVLKNPQGQLEVVDRDGVAFGVVATRPAGVPLVTATGPDGMSQDALRAALGVLRVLPADLARTVGGITVSSADLVTFTTGSTTVRWGGAGQEERKLAIVQALLVRKPKEIDVTAPDTPVTR